MIKKCLLILGVSLLTLSLLQSVQAATEVDENYFTTEDIIADIVFPSIDKKVVEEYGNEDAFGWELRRIVGINYNDNHSYDVSMRVKIDIKDNLHKYIEDLVKVRIYPSCDSDKIKCNHGFKVEVLDYKHLTQ